MTIKAYYVGVRHRLSRYINIRHILLRPWYFLFGDKMEYIILDVFFSSIHDSGMKENGETHRILSSNDVGIY